MYSLLCVVVAENNSLFREGLVSIIARVGVAVIPQAVNFVEVRNVLAKIKKVDLLVIDMDLPGFGGVDSLRQLRVDYPNLRLVVITSSLDRARILDLLDAGVHGCISAALPTAEVVAAIKSVLTGQIYVPALVSDTVDKMRRNKLRSDANNCHLTWRQSEVLELLAEGRSNKEIARLLNIAEGTVKVHVASTFRSLGVNNRVSAASAHYRMPKTAVQMSQ